MLFIFLSLVVVYTRVGPKTNLSLLTKGGLQQSDAVRPYTLTNFLLSLPPGWKALANQRLTFVSYFDQMASPIPVPLKPETAPRAHSPNIAAKALTRPSGGVLSIPRALGFSGLATAASTLNWPVFYPAL